MSASLAAVVSDCDNGQGCSTPAEDLRAVKRELELRLIPAMYLALDTVNLALARLEP